MRFATVLRTGRIRSDIGIDLNNLLNSHYATAYESNDSLRSGWRQLAESKRRFWRRGSCG